MKKILLLVASISLMSNLIFAGNPPLAVKQAFDKKFPNASKVGWGKESANEWEAEFTWEGNKISANFAEDGTWLETEHEIKVGSLPKAVAEAINLNYPGWAVLEANKTESLEHGTIYEADMKKGREKKSIAFKEDGSTIVE